MNKKDIKKKLEKMGYILGQDIFGWIVICNATNQEMRFPTLGGVNKFICNYH